MLTLYCAVLCIFYNHKAAAIYCSSLITGFPQQSFPLPQFTLSLSLPTVFPHIVFPYLWGFPLVTTERTAGKYPRIAGLKCELSNSDKE